MHEGTPPESTVSDQCFCGTLQQRREIERWENAGWILLRWVKSPLPVAVLEHAGGDIVFIDDNGFAWGGANFSKARPVPLEQYPPWGFDEWVET